MYYPGWVNITQPVEFDPRSRISSFIAVSFLLLASGFDSGGCFTSQAERGCPTAGCAVSLAHNVDSSHGRKQSL
jgi:hypothetical protein